jgi:mannose-binding lectin 2
LVEFKISGQGNLYGDGFAMWLTKQRATPGNVFGAVDKFEGLGVFFDTYKNNRPGTVFPYIMAMNGDGTTPYDKDNDGKANELAGCSVRTTLPLHASGSRWENRRMLTPCTGQRYP